MPCEDTLILYSAVVDKAVEQWRRDRRIGDELVIVLRTKPLLKTLFDECTDPHSSSVERILQVIGCPQQLHNCRLPTR